MRLGVGLMNKGGWSWKRQFGVTNAKRRVSPRDAVSRGPSRGVSARSARCSGSSSSSRRGRDHNSVTGTRSSGGGGPSGNTKIICCVAYATRCSQRRVPDLHLGRRVTLRRAPAPVDREHPLGVRVAEHVHGEVAARREPVVIAAAHALADRAGHRVAHRERSRADRGGRRRASAARRTGTRPNAPTRSGRTDSHGG